MCTYILSLLFVFFSKGAAEGVSPSANPCMCLCIRINNESDNRDYLGHMGLWVKQKYLNDMDCNNYVTGFAKRVLYAQL